MADISKNFKKQFEHPDEVRDFKGHGYLEVVNFNDGSTFGRGVFEPGWRWSEDVKPIAGTMSCEAAHHGYCISGRMTIQMNNGDEFTVEPGNVFQIPPGHDAWVIGTEPCVMVDFTGAEKYAKKVA